jgi:hypothetical protein
MAELDIRKVVDSTGDLLAAYINRFVAILSKPKATFAELFSNVEVEPSHRFRNALAFAATSILLGLCLARFVELPNSPQEIDPQTTIAVLLVWIFSAIALHPCLKLFRAKRTLEATLVAFLYTISAVHLLFIPALAVIGHFVTETRVALNYHYVVYFGLPGKERLSNYGGSVGKILGDRELIASLREISSESYIKEREPQKEGTILPPAPPKESLRTLADVPKSPDARTRVSVAQSNLPPPHRTETKIVGKGYTSVLLLVWLCYYLVNSAYLAIGLGAAHQMNSLLLFGLAIVGPPVLVVTVVTMAIFLIYIFLDLMDLIG